MPQTLRVGPATRARMRPWTSEARRRIVRVSDAARADLRSTVATAQAAYYAVSGAWPLLSYRTFEAVTGRKREPWLVKTVGVLIVVIAVAIGIDRRSPGESTRVLGVGSAAALGAVDLWYAAVRRRIRPVYLLDALAEAVIAAAWLRAGRASGGGISVRAESLPVRR